MGLRHVVCPQSWASLQHGGRGVVGLCYLVVQGSNYDYSKEQAIEAPVLFMTQPGESHNIPSAVLHGLKQSQTYLNSRERA